MTLTAGGREGGSSFNGLLQASLSPRAILLHPSVQNSSHQGEGVIAFAHT